MSIDGVRACHRIAQQPPATLLSQDEAALLVRLLRELSESTQSRSSYSGALALIARLQPDSH